MDAKTLIDEINLKFSYDKDKGLLTHLKAHARAKKGTVAGTVNKNGHRYIRLSDKPYTLGQIVWLLETGEIPKHSVYLKDGNPSNTHFSNLRLAGAEARKVTLSTNGTKLLPNKERLEQLFEYSEEVGGLVNKINRNKVKKGVRAGCLMKRGYILVTVDSVKYTEHRLVWWMLKGWDCPKLDHIDRCKTNNRVENLRPVTVSQNLANSTDRRSKLGIPGVRILRGRAGHRKPYAAYLSHQGKQDHLGYYATPEEAFEVHKAAHIARYGEYSKYHIATNAGKEV